MQIFRLSLSNQAKDFQIDFSIDAQHELAKFINNDEKGFKLIKNEFFCNHKNFENKSCSTWYNWSVPNCQVRNSVFKILFYNNNQFLINRMKKSLLTMIMLFLE